MLNRWQTIAPWIYSLCLSLALLAAGAAADEAASGSSPTDAQASAADPSKSAADPSKEVVDSSAGTSGVESAVPAEPPTATELEPGVFRLEFRDSPWLPVLKWYADRAGLNLDWQKLPEGNINLASQDSYRLAEVKDLLNMQLLARGFTMLQRDEVLRVVPLENLDPTLVPRVDVEALDTMMPHDFARVSFSLDWLVAREAAEELKPLLSPYGKLIPLSATNRLEAIDAVTNLRELRKLLDREQSELGRERLVVEFPIKHRRASELVEKIHDLIGGNSVPGGRGGQSARFQMNIERMRLQSQAVQKLGSEAKQFFKDEPEVHMVVNEEKNSILVNAPPDKMELVRQAVEALDQPYDRGEQAWANITRVKVYEIRDADLDSIEGMIDELQRLGKMDRDTRIELDSRNGRLIAYATPSDHLTIAHLVDSFQKEERSAEVIPLTVLDPRYAALAIQTLFSGEDPRSSRRRWGQNDDRELRVQADMVHNRLLLWATPTEMEQIHQFLHKLGEGEATVVRRGARYQVFNANGIRLSAIEERLRTLWDKVSDAPLIIQPVDREENQGEFSPTRETLPASDRFLEEQAGKVEDSARIALEHGISFTARQVSDEPIGDRVAEESDADESEPGQSDSSATASGDSLPPSPPTTGAALSDAGKGTAEVERAASATETNGKSETVAQREPAPWAQEAGADGPAANNPAPPVNVVDAGDGRWIIVSRDPASVGLMQQIIRDLLPEEDTVREFQLKHASALSLQYQIEDLMDLGDRTRRDDDPDPTVLQVEPEKTMEVFADYRTNRLFVRNATPEQLERVERLIRMLDHPEQVDSDLLRYQRIYQVRNKQASELAETVKDVYQDLLSPTDKAFAGRGRNDRDDYGYWGYPDSRSKVPAYKGLLSIGVEESSNSLVVSAPGYLMDEVMGLIRRLDEERAATTTAVLPLSPHLDAVSVQEALQDMVSPPQIGSSTSNRRSRNWRGR